MIDYKFPCYPGDEVWYVERVVDQYYCRSDKVQMVGFTTRSVQIKLREHQSFNRTYTWNKNVFATEREARAAIEKLNNC